MTQARHSGTHCFVSSPSLPPLRESWALNTGPAYYTSTSCCPEDLSGGGSVRIYGNRKTPCVGTAQLPPLKWLCSPAEGDCGFPGQMYLFSLSFWPGSHFPVSISLHEAAASGLSVTCWLVACVSWQSLMFNASCTMHGACGSKWLVDSMILE